MLLSCTAFTEMREEMLVKWIRCAKQRAVDTDGIVILLLGGELEGMQLDDWSQSPTDNRQSERVDWYQDSSLGDPDMECMDEEQIQVGTDMHAWTLQNSCRKCRAFGRIGLPR